MVGEEELRAFVHSLAHVSEALDWGGRTFRARRKVFMKLNSTAPYARLKVPVRMWASLGLRRAMSDPGVCVRPWPGWISVDLARADRTAAFSLVTVALHAGASVDSRAPRIRARESSPGASTRKEATK